MFAQKLKQARGDGYFDIFYVVYNGDIIGTYSVCLRPDGSAYGASRDYHRLATEQDIARRAEWERYDALSEEEQDKLGDYFPYAMGTMPCMWHDDKQSVCDGSGLVEIITDNDEAAFKIAAMMAEV